MKKTLLIIQWIVSCFIILMGLANITSSPLGAIFLMISGVIILPPILKIIKEKFKKNGNIISITICTVAFILGIAITGNSSTANNANEIAMQNQQNTAIANDTINNISNNSTQNLITNEAVNSVTENNTVVENNVNTQTTTDEIQTTQEEQTTNKTVENNTNESKTKSNKTTTASSNTKKTTTQKQETTSSNTNTQTKTKTQTTQTTTSSTSEGGYIVNKNSHVFHKPNCPSVKRMNESNKIYSSKSRAELINEGCKSCNNCNS